MNPIGNTGIFASLTASRSNEEARKTAITCGIAVAITLLAVTWSSSLFLALFGITVDELRTAGGIIVLLIGLHMLTNNNAHRHTPGEREDAADRQSIAIVPLTIPIVAGPGTLAAVMVTVHKHSTVTAKLEISAIILALSLLTAVLFALAGPISEKLGESGMGVVTRIMGMVLAAIAMGMLADGLKGLFPVLAG